MTIQFLESPINQVDAASEEKINEKEQKAEKENNENVKTDTKKEKSDKSSVFKKIKNFFEEL
jgi:TPP-dependent pyruvate/acetoin dehydrogenase alpha subunit